MWVRGVNEYTYLLILSHLSTRFLRVKIFIAVLVPSSTQVDHVIICINVPSMLLSLLSLLHSMFCVVFLCPWKHMFLGIIFCLRFVFTILIQVVFKSHLKKITTTQSANSHTKSQFDLSPSYINLLLNGSKPPTPVPQLKSGLLFNFILFYSFWIFVKKLFTNFRCTYLKT